MIVLIARRPGLTLEEFCRYYEFEHAPLAARVIPADVSAVIKHYQQDHALRIGRSPADPAYDCVTEFEFEDLAGLRIWTEWYRGPGGKVLRDDEENFMDIGRRVIVVTDVRPATLDAAC
ncbi:EthD domain-containing protein [Nocardia jiangxiensis]|uniref:EthD domain-containing protein n=1 Tax=Nocardia jiangxiensis TaxID=282685 RepID=A0ABW6RU86_9NOCA|nr:EthD domain-containing protein [Nocardia jiangxiensis]